MAERYLIEFELLLRHGRMLQQIVPEQCAFARTGAILRAQVGQVHDMLKAFERGNNFGELCFSLECFSTVAVAVDTEKHFWGELLHAVNHPAGTEVRRAARPDRADRR